MDKTEKIKLYHHMLKIDECEKVIRITNDSEYDIHIYRISDEIEFFSLIESNHFCLWDEVYLEGRGVVFEDLLFRYEKSEPKPTSQA